MAAPDPGAVFAFAALPLDVRMSYLREAVTCRRVRNCLVQSIGSAGRTWNNLTALASSGAFSSMETRSDLPDLPGGV